MTNYSYIFENYTSIQNTVKHFCKKYNRDFQDITTIAVSKNYEVEKIEILLKEGVKDFGESRVQEFLPKYDTLKDFDINWHFIGHLQKNKVKYIVDKVSYIHSVDSFDLAKKISDECVKKNTSIKIFLQVNIGEDNNKFGFTVDEILKQYESVIKLPNIKVCGLMTILPNNQNADFVDNLYSKMNNLALDISRNIVDNSNKVILSMGMSNDYEYAIKNNCSFIRIGTAIFK